MEMTKVNAANSRLFDFNASSDLTDYFNPDASPTFTFRSFGGIGLSGSILVDIGYEDIWTSKTGYLTSGSTGVYKITGYFRNEINSGYGSLGFTNTNAHSGDGLGSPEKGVGLVFHGGGGYFVSNGVYTDIFWPPDLDLDAWYKFEFSAEEIASNKFNLTVRVYKADELGSEIEFKTVENLEVTNSDLASAAKLYSYFGTAESRVTAIDNIKIELSGGPTFEEDGKPITTTVDATDITSSSAKSGGSISSENGSAVTAKGVCYGTSSNPTISGTCTSDGTGPSSFISNLTGLSPNTTYYYRSFATNNNGTSYGAQKTLTTLGGNSGNNTNSKKDSKKSKRPLKCLNTKPPKTSWINLIPSKKNGKSGIELSWSQNGADKVTILIDNGSGKYPYSISKTKNDGKEFLPNVNKFQKIKIIPYNGCKKGEELVLNK